MKKLYSCLILLGIATALPAVPSHAASVQIDKPKIELELAPGETYSGEVTVENSADEELKVRLYLEDWKYKSSGKGDKDFFPGGSTEQTASPWITFSPADEVLKPFGHVTARYTVRVPESATGGHYSVLFFETILGSAEQADGSNILVAGRIGALFFIRVKGTVEAKGEFRSIELVPPKGNAPLVVRTDFANTGNVEITAAGKFLAMDAAGKIAARGDLGSIYTQSGQSASKESEWIGRLEPGTYQAVLTYDLGGGDIRTEEREFTVT